jgi:hypothetical protein
MGFRTYSLHMIVVVSWILLILEDDILFKKNELTH